MALLRPFEAVGVYQLCHPRHLYPTDFYTEFSSYRTLWFTPLRLCEYAESGLITSVGWDFPSTLHIYYTTKLWICQEVFQKFLKNFFEPCTVELAPLMFQLVLRWTPTTISTVCFPRLLTLLLYHKINQKSMTKLYLFCKRFVNCARAVSRSKSRLCVPTNEGAQKRG